MRIRDIFYEIGSARLHLPPAQSAVPLLVAATGPQGIVLAARHAAIWACRAAKSRSGSSCPLVDMVEARPERVGQRSCRGWPETSEPVSVSLYT